MIVAVLQARYSSTRLPGKVLRPILGRPMLALHLERLRASRAIERIVVATSTDPSDDAIATLAQSEGADVFRGSLDDVLGRVHAAAVRAGARHVVRLTGDCPLCDPALVDHVIRTHLELDADYTSNTQPRSYPDGLDVEVVRRAALDDAHREAELPSEREHVTPFVYHRKERYRVHGVTHASDLSKLRIVVDHEIDLELVAEIFARLYPIDPAFGMDAILRLNRDDPALFARNAAIDMDEGWAKSMRADDEFRSAKESR